MQDHYDFAAVEAVAQAHWRDTDAFRTVEHARAADGRERKKFYACSMLPYPSGKLHMGHVRNYTINDVMARYLRMNGCNVLMPMGWDAFGLPAENAAIDNGVPPAKWTYDNIAEMKAQMAPLGLAIDWSREVTTCKPDYYRWNQWLFLKMLEKGIAYRRTGTVNWDPVDQTVLANEQVIDGRGWRSGAVIEKREIPMYYLRITDYADELLADLDRLDWPERVKTMQRNWIGKSVGVNIGFPYEIDGQKKELHVFTTRADTLMGVSFVAIAPEHPLAARLAQDQPALQIFIEDCVKGGIAEADLAAMEKKGMTTHFHVTHPLSGELVPVWVGNYVLMGYGEGAVMGVPAHDARDYGFAKKYGLAIKPVIVPTSWAKDGVEEIDGPRPAIDLAPDAISTRSARHDESRWAEWDETFTQYGVCVNSGVYDGLEFDAAVDAIAHDLKAKGLGEKHTTWRLRDWGISRQRYWGTPIPLIHCTACGDVPVPEKDLPVVLPEDLVPDGSGNPLKKDARFLNCVCPKCGKSAQRETDTMDTFVDSAWYYMRYCSPDAEASMVDARNDYWMPMDQYIGGIEHAILHLLYARFWTKVMRDLGLVQFDEPFARLFTQGMLTNESFYREDAAGRTRWFYPGEVEVRRDEKGKPIGAVAKEDGQPVVLGGIEKMSKSKNNVVEPRDFIERFGADTARVFVMFAGPTEQSAPWSDAGAQGASRFLHRLWAFALHAQERGAIDPRTAVGKAGAALADDARKLRFEIHAGLRQAHFDYERLQYNTVVSACMKMLNALDAAPSAGSGAITESFGILLRSLYPIAPHITHALWTGLGFAAAHGDILDAPWPQVDEAALKRNEIELVVQVNGKRRSAIRVPVDASRETIEATALADEAVKKFLHGTPKKVVVVPGRLVNVVV